jgi:hypothetical protein
VLLHGGAKLAELTINDKCSRGTAITSGVQILAYLDRDHVSWNPISVIVVLEECKMVNQIALWRKGTV